MAEYFIGLDLGQAVDYTALAILERTWRDTGGQRVTRYDVGHLERPPRGTSYPAIVALVQQRATAAAARGTVVAVAVDRTGVGAPVVDLLQRARLPGRIVPITITGGDTVGRDGPGFRVPKRDLVALLGVLLQSERLRVAQALPEAATFVREAVNFRARISAAGHDAYGAGGDGDGWREGPHDDLLLAVALAAWCAEAAPAPNPALGIVAHRLAASPWSRADRRDAPASIVTTNGGPERPSRRRLS